MVSSCQLSETGSVLFVLGKVTLLYLPDEDRLCLNGLSNDGDTVRLWITRRLAVKLIAHLSLEPMLSSDEESNEPAETDLSTGTSGGDAVPWDDTSFFFLVVSIDIKIRNPELSLIFKGGNGVSAALSVGNTAGQKLLAALRSSFAAAAWPEGDPEHVTEDIGVFSETGATIH